MQAGPPDVFISLVGLQPAATALLLKTWSARVTPPAEIWLLATDQVLREGIAGRLRDFCQRTAPRARCEIVPIANDLQDEPGRPSARSWMREFLARQSPGQTVFAADPGPGFLLAALARSLPPEATLLHASTEVVFAFQRWNGWEAWKLLEPENLGLEQLLELYGVEACPAPGGPDELVRQGLEGVAVSGWLRGPLVLRARNGATLRLEYAGERWGWLYGLCAATGKNSRQRIHEIVAAADSLNHLNPVLTVFCPDYRQRLRIRAAELHAVGRRGLRRWFRLHPQVAPGHSFQPDTNVDGAVPQELHGSGGEGPSLLVWMGKESAATLNSIFTHRPRQLHLFYDASTPAVVEQVRRLAECASSLPAGAIHLIASDHLGRGVSQRIAELNRGAIADVTPGTMAQSEVFARIPRLELWSQSPPYATQLEGARRLELRPPDLLTQARMCGGRLASRPRLADAKRWDEKYIRFLLLLARAVACGPEDLPLDPLAGFARGRTILTPLPTDSPSRQRWKVQVDGERAHGSLPSAGGAWLERVVAAACVQAGTDEVWLNLEWDWPPDAPPAPREGPRSELNVAARFGWQLFALSCKLRTKGGLTRRYAAEIEAVASTGLGRFAIPVLVRVRPRCPPGARIGNTALLDLDAIAAGDFRHRLDELAQARRTLLAQARMSSELSG